MKIDREEHIWRTYTADVLGLLIKGVYNNDSAKDFPLYSDFLGGGKTIDNRSAQEIINDILGQVEQIEGVRDEPS